MKFKYTDNESIPAWFKALYIKGKKLRIWNNDNIVIAKPGDTIEVDEQGQCTVEGKNESM